MDEEMLKQPERPELSCFKDYKGLWCAGIHDTFQYIGLSSARTKSAALKQAARRLRSLADEIEKTTTKRKVKKNEQ